MVPFDLGVMAVIGTMITMTTMMMMTMTTITTKEMMMAMTTMVLLITIVLFKKEEMLKVCVLQSNSIYSEPSQGPITRGEQLPYWVYVKAFLRNGFRHIYFKGTFSRENKSPLCLRARSKYKISKRKTKRYHSQVCRFC